MLESKSYNIANNTISGKVDEAYSKNEKEKGSPGCLGYRHLVAFYCFFYFGMVDCHISTISISIVAMVNHTRITMENGQDKNETSSSCPVPVSSSEDESEITQLDGSFAWDAQTQGLILSMSTVGYILSNFFAGRIGEIVGAKRTLVVSDLLLNLCTIISPFAAYWSKYALLVVQMGRGLFQGFVIPVLFIIMANWFPRRERGLLSSFATCGCSFWPCIIGLAIGKLCDTPSLGWPSAFYFMGGFNLLVSLTFILFIRDVPKLQPRISKAELEFIISDQESDMSLKRPPAPWKAILTSIPVHALNLGRFGLYWGICHFLYMHPTFMGTVLHISMTDNGLFTAMLFILMTLGTIFSMTVSYWLRIKNILGVNALRKGCSTISCMGCAISLLGVRFASCNITLNMVFCGFAVFFCGIGMCGTMIASGDMSPKFSGSIAGISSAIGCLSATFINLAVGAIAKDETMEEWHYVFYMHMAVIGTGGLIFQVFGSADIQPFDSVKSPDEKPPSQPHPLTHRDSDSLNRVDI